MHELSQAYAHASATTRTTTPFIEPMTKTAVCPKVRGQSAMAWKFLFGGGLIPTRVPLPYGTQFT